MNEIYERLKHLWDPDGVLPEEGSAEDGAVYAFAVALTHLKERLDGAVSKLLLCDDADYSVYAGLLALDPSRFTSASLAAAVKDRLSHHFGDYSVQAMENAFSLVGSGTFSCSAGNASFADVAPEDLGELGKFIAAFLMPYNAIAYAGDGMTFDAWDALELTFFGFDSMLLPFTVLDSYRRTE